MAYKQELLDIDDAVTAIIQGRHSADRNALPFKVPRIRKTRGDDDFAWVAEILPRKKHDQGFGRYNHVILSNSVIAATNGLIIRVAPSTKLSGVYNETGEPDTPDINMTAPPMHGVYDRAVHAMQGSINPWTCRR